MLFKIICVLHGEKLRVSSNNPAIKANPSLSEKGKADMNYLAITLKEAGPFDRIFCSRLDRANASASAVCLANNWDWETIRSLGQHADRQDDVTVAYPSYEDESYPEWSAMAGNFVNHLDTYYANIKPCGCEECSNEYIPTCKALAFTHRAIVACLIGKARELTLGEMKNLARGEELKKRAIHIFERDIEKNTFRYLAEL